MLRSLTLGKIWNNKTKIKQTKNIKDHFPSGPGVKSPPCNARDASSIPGGGTKTPHDKKQLSLQATTSEITWLKKILESATKTQSSQTNKF